MYDCIQKGSTDPVHWRAGIRLKGKDPPGINLKVRGFLRRDFTILLHLFIAISSSPKKKV
jgi:hypothetical protein